MREREMPIGLIPSLEPFYSAFSSLCATAGTWTGDIYAVRAACKQSELTGDRVTRQLSSLQQRGLLVYRKDKERHKRLIWTVTIQQKGNEVL